MGNEIARIPKLPNEIVRAVNEDKLAVFIGAGVSRLIGCWGWDELGRKLIECCYQRGIIKYNEQESLLQTTNSKKAITISCALLKENKLYEVFLEIMKLALKDDLNVNIPNIYDDIYGLRGLFITTNADRLFHRNFNPQNIIYAPNKICPDNIDHLNLYHIHGSIKEPDRIVLTVRDYFERYSNKKFQEFLKKIFDEYTVLFLGYGLGEFELLEYLFQKFDSQKSGELKHFTLQPLFSGEEKILDYEQKYYSQMGIRVLAYQKDERGYHQLENVLSHWHKDLNRISAYLYSSFGEIDKLIEIKSDASEVKLFQLILNDKPFEDYTFRKMAEHKTSFQWLIALKDKGYFDGGKNLPPQEVKEQPGFFTIPFWNVLPYLEQVAKINKENPSGEITNGLVEIVDSVISFRDGDGKRIDNYRTDWFITKIIFMLPYEKWDEKHIDFVRMTIKGSFGGSLIQSEIIKSVLPSLIGHKLVNLILKLLEVILDFKVADEKTEKIKSVMEEYWLGDALKKFKKQIAELCGLEAVKIGINTIQRVLKEDKNEFSEVWITAIEDNSQNQFPDRYECQLVFFIRDMFENLKPEEIRDIIKELLTVEYDIFKRIAIHTINRHYKELNDLFWGWNDNPLNEYECKHELFELLKENCSLFTKEQIDKLLGWIESKDYGEYDDERKEQALAYKKKEWLSTLLPTNDSDVIKKYKEYDGITPGEIEHAGFLSWHESGWANDISPIPPDELLKKTNEEIAEYLRIPLPERGWKKPSQEGLEDCLRQCVKENPEKFTKNLKPFLKVPRIYQNSILRGFYETRISGEISWKKVFEFIAEIIGSNDFWSEKNEKQNYRDWIISTIADLVERGANHESNLFGDELLPEIEKILLTLVEKTEAEEPQMKRLIDHVLNSPKGKIFSAIIHYSFCYSRLKKDEKIKWPEAIKKDFTRRLDRSIEPSIDYSVTLGKYLGNIIYLDKEWVFNNIEKIFPKNDPKHWDAAFGGYLSSRHIYGEPYQLLRKNGHYAKALETDFSDDYAQEKLVQHICVGFLEDWEKLDDSKSLICLLLNKGKPKHLSEIVQFLGSVEGEGSKKKVKEKIKPLWKRLFEILEKNQNDKTYQSTISGLHRWLDIIDEIDDEITPWVKLTAKYINVNFRDSQLVKNLVKHVEKNPKNVGEIYIEMLNGGAYPEFKQEEIKTIVQCLYSSGFKEYANTICNMYGEVGYYFLRELYEENNKGK